MARNAEKVRRLVASALLAVAVWAGVHVVGGEPRRAEPALTANKCILCSAFGASHVPRICTSCNNKFGNKCILCNAFSPSHAPRICTGCNNKY